MGFLFFITLLIVGIVFGSLNERKHLKRLRDDEAALAHIPVFNLKSVPTRYSEELSAGGVLVTGNVVIAIDYFKRFISFFPMLLGGRLGAYETLIDRARREAIVRMQRQADDLGASVIYNVRIEFSIIGQQPKTSGAELLAFGTAVHASQVNS